MLVIIFLLFIAQNIGWGKFAEVKKTCKLENNETLSCNFVPQTIPEGIVSVYINLDINLENVFVLKNNTFASKNWDQVKLFDLTGIFKTPRLAEIQLRDNCFQGLLGLEELRLHGDGYFVLSPDAFVGLDYLKTLDMSSCVRVRMNDFMAALNGSKKLPRIRNLLLSKFASTAGQLLLDSKFVEILKFRKISYIDLSSTQINEINLTAIFKELKYLENINGSHSIIDDIEYLNLVQNDLKHFHDIDLSYVVLPKSAMPLPPGRLHVSNTTLIYSDIKISENLKMLLTPENVNGSGLIPHITSIWIENCSVVFDQNPHFLTKTLTARENNLKRLDLQLFCPSFTFLFSSIESIDFSSNGLEFLHPGFFNCMPNLKNINLSRNQLFNMAKHYSYLFEKLFIHISALEKIDLSRNELQVLPPKFIETCRNLRVIYLSDNKIQQIHFTMKKLPNLQLLDLHGNDIHILDSITIGYLNNIRNWDIQGTEYVTVILSTNPFSCASCTSMHSIEWILTTNLVNMTSQSLKCLTEKGMWEPISYSALNKVKRICERRTIILSTAVSAGAIVVMMAFVIILYYRRKRRARKASRRTNVLNLLRDGEGVYEFAVFLVFSNDDEDFVTSDILAHLNENLQLMTGIGRELVCTGDRHFRPGFYVHSESFKCLDSASVVVAVVSNSFCLSEYCLNELDQAHVKRKPIVLMLIEHIDVNVMSPTMKELYQHNVRVLWANVNGRRLLKTTWENICESILDLIQ